MLTAATLSMNFLFETSILTTVSVLLAIPGPALGANITTLWTGTGGDGS